MYGFQAKKKDSFEIYRRCYENHPFPVLIIDAADKSFVLANKSACNFFKLSKQALKKLSLTDLNLPVCDTHDSSKKSPVYKFIDGSERYVEIYKEDFKTDDKLYTCLFINEITEIQILRQQVDHYKNELSSLADKEQSSLSAARRELSNKLKKEKQIERRIRDQLSFLRILIDTVANPIFIKDKNRNFVDCNTAFEKYFSLQKKSVIGRNVFQLFPDEIACRLNNIDEEIFRERTARVSEITIEKSPNTEQKNVIVTENLFFNEDNELTGYVSVLIDITNFKKMEKELINALEKEKKLNDIKSRLLSTSSHEFRTPLTTILTSSELLLMVGRTWPEARYLEQIIKIQNAVSYMTGLLDDILNINRTDREVWKFNPSMINLNDLCRKMTEDASNLATPRYNINYNYLLNSRHAIVDEKLLQHIISNLLSNAVKYSPEGGEVNFKIEESSSNLIFTVSDHGIGIPEQDKDNLFETFYRCRNSSNIKGTGLGLAIVKRSVESHGGEIQFHSRINEGTTFVVSIPIMTSILSCLLGVFIFLIKMLDYQEEIYNIICEY